MKKMMGFDGIYRSFVLHPLAMMGKSASRTTIKTLFRQGKNAEVVERFRGSKKELSNEETACVIGALSFLGHVDEADSLFSQNPLSEGDGFAARFFLSIGHTRVSNFSRAKFFLQSNRKEKAEKPSSLFFRYQGAAIDCFYRRKFKSCEILTERALHQATQGKFLYGHAWALDLLGHVQLQNGAILKAFVSLSRCIQIAQKMGNAAISSSVGASLLINQIQYGFFKGDAISILQEKIEEVEAQDSYTRANLQLELSRRLTLAGRFQDAESVLKDAIYQIYGDAPPRQEALVNLRIGELNFQRGDFHQALMHIGSARRVFRDKIDPFLIQQISGLELKVMKAISFSKEAIAEREKELLDNSDRFQNLYNLRHLHREKNLQQTVIEAGQDRIGDLVESINAGDPNSILSAVEWGVGTPLIDHYGIERGKPHLVVDEVIGLVLTYERNGFSGFKLNRRGYQSKLLNELASGFRSKESLIEKIWGYRYEAARHDSLIYTQMNKLRRELGSVAKHLRATLDGYEFDEALNIQLIVPAEKEKGKVRTLRTEADERMNHRQIQIIRDLDEREFTSTPECAERFQVSEITANRDLRELVKMGVLKKVGKARSTRYAKT